MWLTVLDSSDTGQKCYIWAKVLFLDSTFSLCQSLRIIFYFWTLPFLSPSLRGYCSISGQYLFCLPVSEDTILFLDSTFSGPQPLRILFYFWTLPFLSPSLRGYYSISGLNLFCLPVCVYSYNTVSSPLDADFMFLDSTFSLCLSVRIIFCFWTLPFLSSICKDTVLFLDSTFSVSQSVTIIFVSGLYLFFLPVSEANILFLYSTSSVFQSLRIIFCFWTLPFLSSSLLGYYSVSELYLFCLPVTVVCEDNILWG